MSERIARLRIELQELEPKIWRRIDIPLSTTLEALHEAIQMTMGWTFSHLWKFEIGDRRYGDPSFREFDDEPVIYKAKGLRLGTAIERGADRFVYVYDYGDNWRHEVTVEEVRDGDPEIEYPAFVDGARRCPPEDGGVPCLCIMVASGKRLERSPRHVCPDDRRRGMSRSPATRLPVRTVGTTRREEEA